MNKSKKWSWSTPTIEAAAATAAALLLSARPKDPHFELISIELTSFKLNFPLLDAELILTVQVTNPNIVSIEYPSAEMSISYSGSVLGSAVVRAGSQSGRSRKVVKLPARLDGLKLASQMKQFVADVAKREMVMDASVEIEGVAKVLWWDHKFKVHVNSHVIVDPVFLDIIHQENVSEMEVFVTS
ncbi:hypothetical protein LIER_33425 [Lithospermum erythrorhizon]|uniref:Water stress and hypersensitive response domain-containing protein n=1 Tax=Lithospermum erythrorhizon TaxID=34254 RepID=A0AAV3S0S0_LITER